MRLLGKLALGGGVVSAATAGVLVAAGVFTTSATLILVDPVAPRAEAKPKALTAFDSCDTLLDWYVDNAVKEVGPYGWGYPMWADHYGRVPMGVSLLARSYSTASDTTASLDSLAKSPSETGTNTQEAAVDEPDTAKTNGEVVVRIVDDRKLVIVDVSGTEAEVLRRVELPRSGYESQLLLVGDHVLVTQQANARAPQMKGESHLRIARPGRTITRVLDFDITDPADPRLVSTDRFTGRLLSARQYGDDVRLVTGTARPDLAWVFPKKGVSDKQATRFNRAKVRRTTIEQWLPAVTRGEDKQLLTACEDVLHPKEFAGDETVAVTTFSLEDTDERQSVAVTAAGQTVYSSADRLYVASADYTPVTANADARVPFPSGPERTAVHAFDVSDEGTSYVGSGSVLGSLRDRWSLDEHDGHLRLAWTRHGKQGRPHNGISILTEKDGALVPTAVVRNLGINENLQSVRWFDDLAVLVTFRQIDPLYTIDLSDQANPKVLGELKIPGYSGYLHPIGDHLLLGLGVDADERGQDRGAQAAVFDITDPTRAVQVSKHRFGLDTYLSVLDDPLGFTWVPSSRTALTPVNRWGHYDDGSAELSALRVSTTGTLSVEKFADLNESWGARSFALADGRTVVLDRHRVRVLD